MSAGVVVGRTACSSAFSFEVLQSAPGFSNVSIHNPRAAGWNSQFYDFTIHSPGVQNITLTIFANRKMFFTFLHYYNIPVINSSCKRARAETVRAPRAVPFCLFVCVCVLARYLLEFLSFSCFFLFPAVLLALVFCITSFAFGLYLSLC